MMMSSHNVFDDSCREFFRDFQWYRLGAQIEQKCNAAGIIFERSSAAIQAEAAHNDVSAMGEVE